MTDELRQRLQASDPAASLPAADPDGVARLLEDVMSTEPTTETRETGTHGRSPLTWLVAAAAVLIIAGIGVFAVRGLDGGPAAPPSAGGGTGGAQTVTELGAPAAAAYSAKCLVPNAETLAQQDVAFDGTVSSITDGTVTLDVTHWYAGGDTDLARVKAPPEELQELVGAVRFEPGGRYLVSASDGQVTVCGFSAPWSSELADLYQQAFG
ncbi:hypothetical protein [Nocardioides sp.]|uniref:hypothetical protein n=1 Tax=Nocardioides sp. TaxID=35761 RepID=UPI0037845922